VVVVLKDANPNLLELPTLKDKHQQECIGENNINIIEN
jgi:hypothetical protein